MNKLVVSGKETEDGISIEINGKSYAVRYPKEIWTETPSSIRKLILDNVTFASTHTLGVSLCKDKVEYTTTDFPLFEPFWFRNQTYDMLDCEALDNAEHLSYMRSLYNMDYSFANVRSTLPRIEELLDFKASKKTAIIPFTFGLESLTTFAVCRELGIEPILVYCQETSQPYEESIKIKMLERFSQEFNVKTFFMENGTSSFRDPRNFPGLPETEIGWGAETTIFLIMMLPYILKFNAGYVLSGSEYVNNDYFLKDGWKVFASADETSYFSVIKNNIIQLATFGQTEFKCTFEPIDKPGIFSMLYRRYPDIAKYQFSCEAKEPIIEGTHWCHKCEKCVRNYMLSIVCGIDPELVGLKYDLLQEPGLENAFFCDAESTTLKNYDNFLMELLIQNGYKSPYLDGYQQRKKEGRINLDGSLKDNYDYFTSTRKVNNLPDIYREKLYQIYDEEFLKLRDYISKNFKII